MNSNFVSFKFNSGNKLRLNNYYPGGMVMPERSFSYENYGFGFNGQEKDDEVKGSGNSYTAEYWQYDSRLSRRWNLDPQPRVGISDYSAFGNNPILNIDPNGAFFFGAFGSTAKQRQAAKRDAATLIGGEVFDLKKKSIHVNYTQGSYSDEEGVTVVGTQRFYRSNGTPETGSVLLDEWHDRQLEAMGQGRLLWSDESGEYTTIVYDGIKPDYTLESMLIPIPKGIGLLYNGTIGGISKVALKSPRLGRSAPVVNTYTLEAMDAGYSTAIVGEKVKAGFFVQLNHNIPNLWHGQPWSMLYSRSAATIMGRTWQNQAIGLGLTNLVGGTSLSIYNFNQSISGVQNE